MNKKIIIARVGGFIPHAMSAGTSGRDCKVTVAAAVTVKQNPSSECAGPLSTFADGVQCEQCQSVKPRSELISQQVEVGRT